MTLADDVLRQVIDELANTLQGAIGIAAHVHRQAQMSAGDAVALENAIHRALTAITRLQQSNRQGGDE